MARVMMVQPGLVSALALLDTMEQYASMCVLVVHPTYVLDMAPVMMEQVGLVVAIVPLDIMEQIVLTNVQVGLQLLAPIKALAMME